MKKLVLETTSPFQGLPELVAYDEGLFAKEGIQVEWADRDEAGIKTADTVDERREGRRSVRQPRHAARAGQGRHVQCLRMGQLLPRRRHQVGSRQVGRRAIVTYAAIVVRPDSPVYTPQQLAGRTVGVPFYAGTHYLALHLLEGFMPRDQINVCARPNGSRNRFDLMMKGEIEATTLTEPYITLAEKKGCRVICSAFFHGTEVASDRVDAETYAAFNRAVSEAVRRINANKKAYLHYFIDYHKARDPEIGTLKPEDLREGRIVVVDPAPIPADEMQRTYDWVKSWGMLEEDRIAAAARQHRGPEARAPDHPIGHATRRRPSSDDGPCNGNVCNWHKSRYRT